MAKDRKLRALVKLFSSTQLTVVVLALLALLSIIGTVVIQKGTDEAGHITHVYSPQTIKIFETLGFFDIYHSYLYTGLIGILILNLLFCSYLRTKKDLNSSFGVDNSFFPENLEKLKYFVSLHFDVKGNISGKIEKSLKKEGFSINKLSANRWIGNKGRWGRFGFYIAHLGILIILCGGIISSLFSLEGFLWMVPGDVTDYFISNSGNKVSLGFRLKCEDFRIQKYPNGMIKKYESRMLVKKDSGEEYPFSLIVNRPLTEGGFRLYQASYQQSGILGVTVVVYFENDVKKEITLSLPGEATLTMPDQRKFTLKAIRFEPDFVISQGGHVTSRSGELNNPALQYQVTIDNQPDRARWVFANFDMPHEEKVSSYKIKLKKVISTYATGIEVVRDPGSILIWIGSITLICGLIVSFFVFPEKVWVEWSRSNNKGILHVAGTTSKSWLNFQKRIRILAKKIEENIIS